MRLFARLAAVALIGLSVSACTSTGGSRSSGRGPITLENIQESNVSTNAFDVVQSLRPEWLRTRGVQTLSGEASDNIKVYVNGSQYGTNPESLRGLQRENVQRIEFLSASQATTRYGAGHTQGAILVETR